jgi:phage gp36-like protein
MALKDEAIARYSLQTLLNLSNPDSAASVTNDTTRLDKAATDAEADFEMYTAVDFDITNPMHVSVGCEGVKLLLQERGAAADEDAEKFRKRWIEKLKDVAARIGGEQRILAQSTGIAAPSSEEVVGGTTRQKFDSEYFRDLTPGSPPARSVDRVD